MEQAERDQILARLRTDASRIASHFGLAVRAIVPEHPRVKSRYGVCFADGLIKIRLTHATTGRPLRYSSLVDTLCHELAHLRHFDHSPEFQRFYGRVLAWARREGIYRPASRRPASATAAPVSPTMPVQRNGVAVFDTPSAKTASTAPRSWTELLVRQLEEAPPAAPRASSDPSAKGPATSSPPAKLAPRQLTLFA